ncbi:MFS general substrate transporter [Gymnopus androsaceus JB14]|uniref:MFS general substrate transporter n=1 Tax=Gymnopus androsaceus JB14 TaxID=1447944 RepID=A0A6A4HX99_9AGAR|nr:MFS general substrate transporter [Gymnopus androsaceus JB14]
MSSSNNELQSQSRSIGSRISRIIWDRDDKPEPERKFVQRLDWGLMTVACLGYFVKYLDQANISNAYVSGMEEALHFKGNEYNTLLTMFTVGYVVGQYPSTLLMVKVSPSIWLPACELIWTILVMCCAVAKSVRTLYALRFLIGLAEAAAYPGMLWVLGSWYGPSELSKRTVLFICCSSAGTMFSGYLQAAVYDNLDGVSGRAGWQWLFLMDGVISFLNCGLAQNTSPFAQERATRFNRAPTKGSIFNLRNMLEAFKNWVPWTFMVPYTCFVVGLNSYAYMNLWLKKEAYTVAQINLIPTGGYALQIFMALIYSWVSDAMQKRWPVILFASLLPLIGNIILSVWPNDKAALFAGFYLNFTITGCGAITLAWANELTSYSAEHRAITIGFLNTASYVFNAWVPNLIFPASQAPHYKTGINAVFLVGTALNAYLSHLKAKEKKEKKAEYEGSQQTERNAQKKVASQKAVYKGGASATVTGVRYEGEKSGVSKVVKSVRLG